jgi:3-phosphoshikimate 1-carboxyvinyltransferase
VNDVMRLHVTPGRRIAGEVAVPGDKSISHRWLLLGATADGEVRIEGLPRSLDVGSTAACLSRLAPAVRPALEVWSSRSAVTGEGHGSTWNREPSTLEVERLDLHGEGRASLQPHVGSLDCGNSGTTMRLLCGTVAASPFPTVLVGDRSLSSRPMERVARPLRLMGAEVETEHGHPPVTVRGAALRGVRFQPDVPSAQVKGAILLAGAAAEGSTTVVETIATRDHTERALRALGAPVSIDGDGVTISGPFQHGGFAGFVPGDVSSAVFLIAAAAVTAGELTVTSVGLNPSRLHVLEVLRRMGVTEEIRVEREEVGEPVGTIEIRAADGIGPVEVAPDELPLVIDEIPALVALAAHASGRSRFAGAGELRVKESDRLASLVDGVRSLGGEADVEGDDLLVRGGRISGGSASSAGDHRIGMALAVAALTATGPSVIDGIEAATVSFPGFVETLVALGADVEVRT